MSKICKKFIQLKSKQKKRTLFKKDPMVSIDIFSKKDIQMANRHRKWCFTSVIIKGMQIHTNRNYPLTSTKIAIIKKNTNKCWQWCGYKEMLEQCCWQCKLVFPVWKRRWRLFKNKTTSWFSNPTPGHILGESCQLKG